MTVIFLINTFKAELQPTKIKYLKIADLVSAFSI